MHERKKRKGKKLKKKKGSLTTKTHVTEGHHQQIPCRTHIHNTQKQNDLKHSGQQ